LITGFELITRFNGRAFTVVASIFNVHIQLSFGAKNRLLEADFDASFDVPAPLRTSSAATRLTTTEEAIKDITKPEITEVKIDVLTLSAAEPTEAFKRIAACCAANACMPELVVALSFGVVLQHLIGFIELFEFRFITTTVWMVLNSRPTKCFFDLVGTGSFAHA
jgi:hypothetical protein